MKANKKTERAVGALFLISNATFLLGAIVLVEPVVSAPDYLTLVSENRTQVISGVLLELINAVAYVGIAVLVFPILRRRFASLALGYVGFRLVEFVMQVASGLGPLLLVSLSEEFVRAGAQEASSFQSLGALLIAERYWAFQMVSITFGLGALIFYYMFYQSKLIPRFIPVWGLVGAALVLANAVFDMFGISLGPLGNLGVLMLLNELFLGVWLIVKGFNPSAITSGSARTNLGEV